MCVCVCVLKIHEYWRQSNDYDDNDDDDYDDDDSNDVTYNIGRELTEKSRS